MRIRRIEKNRINRIDTVVLLFLFVAVIGFMPTSHTGDNYVWLAAVLIFFANTLIKGKKLSISPSLIWYIAIGIYGGISCLWSSNVEQYVDFVIYKYFVVILVVVCLSGYIEGKEDIDRLFYIMMAAACLAGFRYLYYTDLRGIFSSGYYMRGTFGALLGDTVNYNNFSAPLCVVCVISCYYAFYRNNKWCFIPFVILTIILLFSGSRKTFLTIALISIFYSLMQGDAKRKLKAIVLVIVIILAGWFAIQNLSILVQIKTSVNKMILGMVTRSEDALDYSTRTRHVIWDAAEKVWETHPVLGVGWNNFRYYNPWRIATAHNGYWEVLASLGLVGTILYHGFLIVNFVRLIFDIYFRKRSDIDVMLLGMLAAVLILEYGQALIYGRDTLIVVLAVFLANSKVKGHCMRLVLGRRHHVRGPAKLMPIESD